MATPPTETGLAAGGRGHTVLRLLTFSQERALGRLVVLITAAMSEASHLAGGPVSEVVPVEAVSMEGAGGIADHMHPQVELIDNSRMEKNAMMYSIPIFIRSERKNFVRFAVSVLFALSWGFSSAPIFAQEPGQRTFASAEEAGRALFAAMQMEDEQAPLSILGPVGKEVLSSGDPEEDLYA